MKAFNERLQRFCSFPFFFFFFFHKSGYNTFVSRKPQAPITKQAKEAIFARGNAILSSGSFVFTFFYLCDDWFGTLVSTEQIWSILTSITNFANPSIFSLSFFLCFQSPTTLLVMDRSYWYSHPVYLKHYVRLNCKLFCSVTYARRDFNINSETFPCTPQTRLRKRLWKFEDWSIVTRTESVHLRNSTCQSREYVLRIYHLSRPFRLWPSTEGRLDN